MVSGSSETISGRSKNGLRLFRYRLISFQKCGTHVTVQGDHILLVIVTDKSTWVLQDRYGNFFLINYAIRVNQV